MNKVILSIILAFAINQGQAQVLVLDKSSKDSVKYAYCAGDSVKVRILLTKTFNNTNDSFRIKLGNKLDTAKASPTILTFRTKKSKDTIIKFKLPVTTPQGNNYKISIYHDSIHVTFYDSSNKIIINALPTAIAGLTQTICAKTIANVTGASATNYNSSSILWSFTPGAGSLTSATTLTPSYKSDSLDGGKTIILTMKVNGLNKCSSAVATATYSVTVDPLPTATRGLTQTICANASVNVTGVVSSNSNNSTILWTNSNGLGALTNTTILTPTYKADSLDGNKTVILKMKVNGLNKCASVVFNTTDSIIVDPLPTATRGLTQTICANASANVSGVLSTNSNSSTILWTNSNGLGTLTNTTILTPTNKADSLDGNKTVILKMKVNGLKK